MKLTGGRKLVFGKWAVVGLVCMLIASMLASCSAPAVKKDMVVRMTQSWPCKLDPAVGWDNVSSVAHANIYDTLVMIDPDGSVKPWVAKSWTYDAATKTYTFTLEKGIKFHSGNVLTAADVAFSAKRMLAIGQGWSFVLKSSVKDVVAQGDDVVKFILSGDYGPFLQTLIHMAIVDQKTVAANAKKDGTYGDNGDYGKDWLTTHDAGSGPYAVTEMKTAESLTCARYAGYWKGVAKDSPEGFKMIGTTEAITVRTLMSQKDLEISDEWQTGEAYNQLKALEGVKVADFVVGGLMILHMNTSLAPMDDIHFRKAMQYVFDYASAQKLFPGGKATSGPVGSALPGYNESLPKFAQNIEKAKAELALSKYKDTIGNYEIELGWTSEVPDEEKVALLLQSNAQQIGIKIKVTKAPWLTWIDRASKPTTTPGLLARVQSSISFPEAGAPLDYFRSAARGLPTNCHWFNADLQAQIDNSVAEALATMDSAQRYVKYKSVAQVIVDNATDIWIVEMPQRQAFQSSYLSWPAAEAAVAGSKVNVLVGLRTYFRDMKLNAAKMK